MRALILGATALVLAGGAATAQTGQRGSEARPVVHLCERGNFAEQALKREHGAAPFATASQVLKAADTGARTGAPAWNTPVCMTGLEHYRLDRALRRLADQTRERGRAVQVLATR